MLNVPFSPGQTLTLAVTATSSNANFNAANAGSSVVDFLNVGPNVCFVTFNGAATTAAYPIAAGERRILSKPPGVTGVAAICNATQTATLYATSGQGV
jgi:hypothetical protein